MVQNFQARYYPNGSFMEAGRGSRPSATWTGILKARPLLAKGMRVRIRNGYSTPVWDSPWIPDDGHFTLFTPRPPSTFFPRRVADLIDPITCTWNKQVLENHFWPIDCVRILAIPIGAITSPDRIVWHCEKSGRYSIKSAYKVAFTARSREGNKEMGNSSGEQGVRWNEIWGLTIPPKIRMFIWRACNNIRPHAMELTRRPVSSNSCCIHCKQELETMSHILMECRGLRDIWAAGPFHLSTSGLHDTPWLLFCKMKEVLDPEVFLVGLVELTWRSTIQLKRIIHLWKEPSYHLLRRCRINDL